MDENVIKRIESRSKLVDDKHNFAIRYGFAYKRSQDFKDCIVIRWKPLGSKQKINYARIEEYVDFCHTLIKKYNLLDENNLFLDLDLKLMKTNTYCITEWNHHTWAIPNEFKTIQKFVLTNLPKSAKVSKYK